jgi:hypothetical protein
MEMGDHDSQKSPAASGATQQKSQRGKGMRTGRDFQASEREPRAKGPAGETVAALVTDPDPVYAKAEQLARPA